MYKEDLALNNPQGLICHKTHPTNHLFTDCCTWYFFFTGESVWKTHVLSICKHFLGFKFPSIYTSPILL